ncbi:aldo/keto reductase [Spirosoma rhododendri]|uniref:Aldo/keto reductase n=1 Tax=Spirosoma rhododendri TaxID=2728024 RepID=A0A7L5DPW9_9BACT|nr:aldo/keto reductase [Spirosoma rhododendri]QJD78077.1 aldo/keto reductase [Spirosoma rhododendri]
MENKFVTLNNGVEMPLLGLGVYAPNHNSEVQQAVEWALEAGCRLIDTASIYGNEVEVADAIQASGLSETDVFITTKVWNTDQGYEQTLRAFDRSAAKLRRDVVDLYLIHWPVKQYRHDTWRALEQLYTDGRIRAIGVSNHYQKHLDELLSQAVVVPAVNQIEFSPYCYRPDVLTYCRDKGIQVEGYAPLARGKKQSDPRLIAIAERHHKSTFQVLIRWSLQQGVVTIPKSVHRERIQANFDVFDFTLSADEMTELNTFYDNTRIADDPDTLD